MIVRPSGRFIPAYAGNAQFYPFAIAAPSVHPRIRGERPPGSCAAGYGGGSSPHTRGTHGQDAGQYEFERFIPAYAGNAKLAGSTSTGGTVHPRIRGERINWRCCRSKKFGSSPHTRGTRPAASAYRAETRFIPAYAGNAARPSTCSSSPAVHPRIRGERLKHCRHLLPQGGSSPHTRGTRPPACIVGFRQRFIPAYAGNAWHGTNGFVNSAVHPRIRGERPK